MTRTLSVWVGAEIIYLYGTVNGDAATFTLAGGGEWRTEVPRAVDGAYTLHLEAYSENGLEGTYDHTLHYGMIALVTDRTQADVNRVIALTRRIDDPDQGWDSLTAAEKSEWLSVMKGAYNAEDLNRVGHAVQYIADLLNGYGYYVAVSVRTDWSRTDIPRAADMAVYLGNVQAIKDKFYGTTPLPGTMSGLTHTDANNIEKLLLEIEMYINRMTAGFRRCGTFYSGQGVILP